MVLLHELLGGGLCLQANPALRKDESAATTETESKVTLETILLEYTVPRGPLETAPGQNIAWEIV